jgi:acyl-CoA reductase-like NAD-dependent aldehyde dehydrogenase
MTPSSTTNLDVASTGSDQLNVGINTAQRNHEAPFGGFKMSGVGRDGGDHGLYAYTEIQSIIWPG